MPSQLDVGPSVRPVTEGGASGRTLVSRRSVVVSRGQPTAVVARDGVAMRVVGRASSTVLTAVVDEVAKVLPLLLLVVTALPVATALARPAVLRHPPPPVRTRKVLTPTALG